MTDYNATVIATFNYRVSGVSDVEADSAARRAACGRAGVRATDIHDVVLTELSLEDRMRAANLRTWQEITALRDHGTENQRERWSQGVLPDQEIRDMVRPILFAPFDDMKRFSRMMPSDLPHPQSQRGPTIPCLQITPPPIVWETSDNPPLSSTEWETVTLLRQKVEEAARHPWLAEGPDDSVRLFVIAHQGTCGHCHRWAIRNAVRIHIVWAERTMSREFAL